ncbi:hypothetical protein TBR22_A06040 [Luteitalea sp. TBR-22]|uniref:hypothetical protein n=1 Tax=Luteitalea sp. TBR-22 TaxID=2802971 RepID=UPI001AF30AE3|nr:hypothetical protein [Luteitalea sp. TBR-22]BCS31403.1 hypothetical protein TBR22_A06040 [Luteitalea sp. TBR-22]
MPLLSLRPALVWTLDSAADGSIQRWLSGLDSGRRALVRVVRDEAQARAALREFADVAFASCLPQHGFQFDTTHGVRVRTMLVASAMGDDAFREWAGLEDQVLALEPEVLELERIRLLLVPQWTHIPEAQRRVTLDGMRAGAWLTSGRLDSRQMLSADNFQQNVALALNGLLFAQVTPGTGFSVWDAIPSGSVRLLGVPTDDPERVMSALEEALWQFLIRELSAGHLGTIRPPANARDGFVAMASRFAGGALSAAAVVSRVVGRDGLGAWSLPALLAEGAGTTAAVMSALARPARQAPVIRAPEPETLIDRILAWFGYHRARNEPEVERPAASDEELAFVRARIGDAHALLEFFAKQVTGGEIRVSASRELLERWSEELVSAVRAQLARIGDEQTGARRLGNDIKADLLRSIRAVVLQKLFDEPTPIDIHDGPLQRSVSNLRTGGHFLFTAALASGEHPEPAAVATSLRAPLSDRVKVYAYPATVGAIMFAGSRPCRPEELGW